MKAVLFVACILCCMKSFSQQEYFILIQSDKSQPFYVRLGEKNNSSSAAGHIILSRLKDSTYNIVIGFPMNKFPEQEFVLRVNNDKGYELKNMSDRGWVLFEPRTMEMISPVKNNRQESGGASYSLVKKNDEFARLMAGVVNDTAVLYAVVMEKPVVVEKPAVVKKEPPKNDTVIIAKTDPDQEIKTKDSVIDPPALPVISVVKEYRSDTGYHMLIMDESRDSIDIFIPVEKEEPVRIDSVKRSDTLSLGSYAVDSLSKPVDTVVAQPVDTTARPAKLVMINSDCKAFAGDSDVDKLRIKMMQAKDAVQRVDVARKVFKTKCFTAKQVKALTEFFPVDEEKFNFLSTAYPFVSDASNFKELVSLFTDPVYIKKFRSLVRLD